VDAFYCQTSDLLSPLKNYPRLFIIVINHALTSNKTGYAPPQKGMVQAIRKHCVEWAQVSYRLLGQNNATRYCSCNRASWSR
jgi:hypothetical protein